jgi:hypothetical protein
MGAEKRMNALKKAIDAVGGVVKAAELCGVSQRAVYKWIDRCSLPRTDYTGETHHARNLASASGGEFTEEWLLQHAAPGTVAIQEAPLNLRRRSTDLSEEQEALLGDARHLAEHLHDLGDARRGRKRV